MVKKTVIDVDLKRYVMEIVRYAAYALSGDFHVLVSPGGKGRVRVMLEPKAGAGADACKRFQAELADEKLRAGLAADNKKLREFIVLKALSGVQEPAPADAGAGLTPAQEKELDDLIAQVEKEIKEEGSGKKKGSDPLGITATWEEKYGARSKRKN